MSGDVAAPPAMSQAASIVQGLLTIALGLGACAFPLLGGPAIGHGLGLTLCAAGLVGIVFGIGPLRVRGHWLDLVLGLTSLVFGGAALILPLAGAEMLLWMFGLWFALCGALEVAAGLHRPGGRASLILIGMFDLILSFYLMLAFARLELGLVALLAGLSLIMTGAGALIGAAQEGD